MITPGEILIGQELQHEQLPPNLIKYLTITQLVTTYRRIEKRTSEGQTNIAQKRRPFWTLFFSRNATREADRQ